MLNNKKSQSNTSKPKPDEGRLLTDEEIQTRLDEYWGLYCPSWNEGAIDEEDYERGFDYWTLEAQRDLTRRECREKGERIFKEINNLIIGIDGCKFEERLDGDKGCIVLDMNENQWREFWEKEGVK